MVQVESHSHGGTQVTTRQTIGPRHSICWLHCPYRNRVQQVFHKLQSSSMQWQAQSTQSFPQVPDDPHPQPLHEDSWQSM